MPKGPHSHGNHSDFDEKTKIFDKYLYKKLYGFAKPYKWYLSLVLLLAVLMVGCELAMPLISKHIIDHFINPKYKLVSISEENSAQEFYSRYEKILLKLDNNHFLLQDKSRNDILPQDLKKLDSRRNISREIYYFLSYKKTSRGELLQLENSVRREISFYDDGIIISYENLQGLDGEMMKKLRYDDLERVKFYGLLFLGIIILNFIMTYAQVYSITVMGQKIMFDMRMKLFEQLEKMPVTFFDKNPTGILVTRVTNDIENLQEFFSAVIINLFKNVFVIITILAVLLSIDVQLALISFAILPFIVFLSIKFKHRMRKAYRKVRTAIARINGMLSENISGMDVIQLFNREKKNYEKFAEQSHIYFLAQHKQMFLNSIFGPCMHLLRLFSVALILFSDSKFIMMGALSAGTLVAFLAYIEKFFRPIQEISEKINLMQSAMASSERIFKLLDTKTEEENHHDGIIDSSITIPAKVQGEIEFKNVWFAYDGENWVLKDFCLKIRPGEKFALVGPTGAGKTSVINILNRFYPIQKGRITIDGIDIMNIPLAKLRKYIGIVQQDVFLFSGTVKDNIMLNKSETAEEDKLKEVATYTNAYDFISKLPNKFDTELKEGGASISTGQKQLVSFSRVLAYDPQILVLDEATSNIDTETEILIQDALNKLMEDRTSIIVAHRLSTIQHCDKIVVLQKGIIKEIGSHQELLEKGGIYYNLYLLQYKDQLRVEEKEAV